MGTNKIKKSSRPVANVIIRIVICAIVLLLGVMGMSKLASLKKPPTEVKVKERPLRVEAIQVKLNDFPVFITGYGEAKALNVVSIAPEVSGKIINIHPRLEAGETIPEGDILFKIDAANYSASYKEALAGVHQWENTIKRLKKKYAIDADRLKTLQRNRDLAKAEYERFKRLFEADNVITRSEVEKREQAYNSASDHFDQMAQTVTLYPIQIKEAESSLASTRARLALAKANLDRCQVRAPFTGRVKSVQLEEGEYVLPGQNIITLADDSVLEIRVPLDSRDARNWLRFNGEQTERDSAWFSGLEQVPCSIHWTEDKDGHTWTGWLHRVVRFDRQTRTIMVAVRIKGEAITQDNSGGLPLVEGMFCSVKIPGKTLHKVFRLPRQAVSFENTVYVAVENRLKTVPIEVARVEGEYVYVTGGLNERDTVVTTRLIDPLENTLLEITNQMKEENRS